jgi:hypothetical protein
MKITRARLLALALATSLGACDGDDLPPAPPPPSGPGFLQVVLATERTDAGALSIVLSGGPMDSVRVNQTTLLLAEPGAAEQSLIIAGQLSGGTVILRFWVPDVADVASYSAVVEQAARRGSYEQHSPAEYNLIVARD